MSPRRYGALPLSAVVVFGVLSMARSLPVRADASYVVNTSADAADDATHCTGTNTCTLRDAVALGNAAGGTNSITFASNVTAPIVLDGANLGPITVANDLPQTLSIVGNGPASTIIDGNGASGDLEVDGATVNLSGVTLRNGKAGVGAGLFNLAGVVTVSNSAITGNTATTGGAGIRNLGVDGVQSMTLINTTVAGNTLNGAANTGAGIATNIGDLALVNSTVSGNSNTAGSGGGIGILSFGSPGAVTLTNSTVAGNSAAGTGSGLFIQSGRATGAAFTMTNTILANTPAASNCSADAGNVVSTGHNLDTGTSCGLNGTGDKQDPASNPVNLGPLQDNGGPTPTQALLPGSPAIDAGDNAVCAGAAVNSKDQRGLPRFPAGDVNCDMGAFEVQSSPSAPATVGDFDGDHKSDLTVYRPSTGTWYTKNSGGTPYSQVPWGQPTDVTVPADYDGTGRPQVAIYRPSTGEWFVRHGNGTYTVTTWGQPGSTDVPVPANYEGAGKADIAIYRPTTGEWFVLKQDGNYTVTAWGAPGGNDIPAPADYDGTGKAELTIFRPSTGEWFVLHAGGTYSTTAWGQPGGGDIPVPGDYEGSGKTDIAVYRQSTGEWFVLKQNGSYTVTVWGAPGSNDIPQVGDFNGDGKTDLTVYRPGSTGIWYVLPSDGSSYTATGWGTTGDVPTVLPAAIGHAFFPTLYP